MVTQKSFTEMIIKRFKMTPQELTLWSFALLMLAVSTACTIVVGYVTFKVLRAIKEKGLQAISDWFVEHS